MAGFFHTHSELCSAFTIVTLTLGPSGVTVPLLFMRKAWVGGSTPRMARLWLSPAGAHNGALCILASSGASAMWSKWPCVTSTRSTLPRASSLRKASGVLGLVRSQGSMTMTLPSTVVSLKAA